MPVRPYITLLYLLTVLTALLLLSIFFPSEGVKINENLKLRFISPAEIFETDKEKYADISVIIENTVLLSDTVLADLANSKQTELKDDTLKADADSLRHSIEPIQFPGKNPELFYPFFRSLDKASGSKKPVHILHYGDSQIEGDRISSYLRNRMQLKFGGMGIGLVPVEQMYDFSFSTIQQNSGNWFRYTLYGNRDTSLNHERFGALASFCRFSPPDSSIESSEDTREAWVSFSPSNYSFANTKHFQQCRVFYSHNSAPFLTEIYVNGELADAEIYPVAKSLKTMRWTFDEPVGQLKIVFKGAQSPDIYGISLDGLSGVAIDNIAMRGNSGLVFTKIDKQNLREHYRELNVKLVILQFGGNVVPNITSDYGYYRRLFRAQLLRIREVLPDVTILVIGVADMSMKEKDRYVSYPNIEKVRDALKEATFEANGAYWDMYEAMGGHNSMPSWVFADPPLASKDFVHFNVLGARIIGQMFYNALIYEYNVFKNQEIDVEVATN